MSTPADAYQLTWNFPLTRVATQEDIAEFSLWFAGVGGAEYGDEQLASAAQGGYNAWVNNMSAGHWCNNVLLDSVTATNYLTTGHILHQQNYVGDGSWVGEHPGPAMPWETALAVSLYTYPRGTFVTHGRRKRGRYYMPPMAAGVLDGSNSGYYSDSALAALLAECKAFLEDAGQDKLGATIGTLSVFSRVDSELRPVSQVTLDAKFDSQRRRENREKAGYLVTPFP